MEVTSFMPCLKPLDRTCLLSWIHVVALKRVDFEGSFVEDRPPEPISLKF